MLRKKHKNIPIFIPHMGCPHRCIFCDQRTISGQTHFDEGRVKQEIETALTTITPEDEVEIAYFGGSFTAIDRDLMIRLLDLAQSYVDSGRVSGIRFSTRPDAVGEGVLNRLSHYTISAIELGLQSLDDDVLNECCRGHTAAQAEDACRRIVARGYTLVGQMMLGLPASTPESDRLTAMRICSLGAKAARIYPTVVLEGTILANLSRSGFYMPLTVLEAAVNCAEILDIFEKHGVDVLRVGLCAAEGLDSKRVVDGAYHPAMGEMAYSMLFRMRMNEQLMASGHQWEGCDVTFTVPRGKTSQAVGYRRSNVLFLTWRYGIEKLTVLESDELSGTQAVLSKKKRYTIGGIRHCT